MPFFSDKLFKFLLVTGVMLFFSIVVKDAYAPPPPPVIPTYTWSAHGNTSYGVNRTSIAAFGYSIGNCAHCHEQHASVGGAEPEPNAGDDAGPDIYLLFKDLWLSGGSTGGPQKSEFCFGCHIEIGSLQSGVLNNYSYSYRAGGDTSANCPSSVSQSFQFVNNAGNSQDNGCGSSEGSSHMLRNIRNYLTGQWNFSGTNTEVNPCSGCHNPHRAQKDPHTSPGRFQGQRLYTAVSLPSDHSKDNNAWKLWGDDLDERMSYYALNGDGGGGTYQAPCRYPWISTCSLFEPDGSSTADGSNLFDTVTFCQKCHGNASNLVHSTRLGRDLEAINWGSDPVLGNQHGQNSDNGVGGGGLYLRVPYPRNAMMSATPDYVLSCLDCHEPHGSPNEFLLRQEVNGVRVNVIHGGPISGGEWCDWCSACHEEPHGGPNCAGMAVDCSTCHTHRNQKPSSLF
jgi:hypothetical protein